MRRWLVAVVALLAACGGAGGGGPDELWSDAVADVPGEAAGDAAVGPEAFEWDPSPTPQCSQGKCAAGPDSAPDPMLPGPFPVGVRTVVLVDPSRTAADGSPRTLKTEIWYPTTDDQRGKPRYAYDPKADATEAARARIGDAVLGTKEVDAVRDAPVRHGDGRWPLVMFSHGAYGIRYQSIFLTVPLASHGYVVVSPDHQDNTLYDILVTGFQESTLFQSAIDRPLDILFLMDEMARWDADPANDFYKSIDANNVGVAGHSFGGFTCFGTAWHRLANGDLGLDPRVKVIVPHAPAGYIIGGLGIYLPDWHLPTMMMGGKMDRTLEYEQAFWTPFSEMGAPKWFLSIERGGHYTFSDICVLDLKKVAEQMNWGDAEDALNDGCSPENWDAAEAHKVINLYSIASFNRYLRNSPGSAAYMTPEAGAAFAPEATLIAVPE